MASWRRRRRRARVPLLTIVALLSPHLSLPALPVQPPAPRPAASQGAEAAARGATTSGAPSRPAPRADPPSAARRATPPGTTPRGHDERPATPGPADRGETSTPASPAPEDGPGTGPVSPTPDQGSAPGSDADSSCAPLRLLTLQPRPEQIPELTAAGVDLVTLELGWDAYEPAAGRWNTEYASRRGAEADLYRAAGIDVVLDLGLQYPPAWAWSIDGPTRFVNQYGEEWHGTTGTDVLNAVWNPAVRDAQERYVRRVAQDLQGSELAAVRIGGLLSGELRLPPARTGSRTDALWAFDPLARAASPVPGWTPGTGTQQDADAWLEDYLAALVDYQEWLVDVVVAAFPGVPLDILLPGWGLRPGDVDRAVQERVSRASVEATGDSLSSAVDWERHVSSLAARGVPATLITTWIDAPAYGPAPRDQAPVEYLADLARPTGLPLSGENTGGGGPAALERTMVQATRFDLERVTWLAIPDDPDRVTFADVGAARDAATEERCADAT